MNYKTVIVAIILLFSSASMYGQTINFDNNKLHNPPKNFTADKSGQGEPGNWIVVSDTTAPSKSNVLAQIDMDQTNYRFPVCIYDSLTVKNVEISVRFKPLKGTKDQAAGIVWRYKDNGNYYIVRANALENNVVLYKFENGKRSDIDPAGSENLTYGKKAPVENGKWGSLRVVVKGNHFDVHLNGEKLYTVIDDTFTGEGKIGLWTKADSYTYFDDFSFKVLE